MTNQDIRSLRREVLRNRGAMQPWVLVLFFLLATYHLSSFFWGSRPYQLHSLFIAGGFTFCLLLINRSLGSKPERVVSALRNQYRCATCAYALRGIPPDPDGCTTCPECGSAWRFPTSPPSQS